MADQYRWDNFVLDLIAYRLERAGTMVPLEPKALNLLAFLLERPGRLVTKQEIFEGVWPETAVTDHALTRVIAQLRRALGDEARESVYIETVPTRGYRWVRPLESTIGVTPVLFNSTVSTTDVLLAPALSTRRPAALGSTTPETRRPLYPSSFHALISAALGLTVVALLFVVWSQRGPTTTATAAAEFANPAGPPSRPKRPVQITTHAGLDLQPALSPTGDAIAYVSDKSGALEIYILALTGSATDTPLTSDGNQNVQPAWSPDGRMVAYHSSKRGGVWVVPARGGVPRQIVPEGSNPVWSPDGLRVAFQSDEHADVTPSAWGAQIGSTLWLVDADGLNLKQITYPGRPSGGHAAPAWSRDGRYLAFAVFESNTDNGVWILDVERAQTRLLTRGTGLYELVFAPDGTALYAAGGDAVIVRLPFDTVTGELRGAREIIPIPGIPGVRGLSISTDGSTLAFAGLALNSQIWAQPIATDGSSAGAARPLTRDTSRRNSLPVLSRDGLKVAYMSTRSGENPNVWVMTIDGADAMQLTSDEATETLPVWYADGTRVAYMSSRNNAPGLWSVDIATRREEVLFDMAKADLTPETTQMPGWLGELQPSPSLDRMTFSLLTPPDGRRRLYIASLNPFKARPLTDGRDSVGYPAWSPDQHLIAVEIKEGSSTQAGVIDVATGQLRRVTNVRGQTWVRSWSPDSRRLAVAALRDGTWSLRSIAVAGGKETIITPAGPPNTYVRYPEWSPRGDSIVFERGELRGNVWMLRLQPEVELF